MKNTRWVLSVATVACVLAGVANSNAAAESVTAADIQRELHSFRETGSVLFIAAHPDDEDTQLIAYLARGRYYRTAYLSLTRGDGGQNVLGPEFGEELGVARTQELLAARRIDGGRQFFTRALDFGFSKDYRETFKIWDKDQVLSDVVRVIRTFRPDVLITRFSIRPGGTHGHHTASGILGFDAFKLAGDPKAFPEQLGDLSVWQPKRVFLDGGGGGRGGRGGGAGTNASAVRMDIGGTDPITGESFSEIAGRSRSMHKTQGFGNFGGRGGGGGSRVTSFQLLDGEPAAKDIFDGVDTTWSRVAGGAEVGKISDEIIDKFNPQDPAASVPALLDLRKKVAALPADRIVEEKRQQLDQILQHCLGLEVQTVVPQAEIVPGEKFSVRHTVVVHSSTPIRWVTVRYPALKSEIRGAGVLHTNEIASRDATQTLPKSIPLSQPYWLREPRTTGMFRVDDAKLIGVPENPPAFPVEYDFEVGGQTLTIPDEPVEIITDPAKHETRRRLTVVPPVSIRFSSNVELFAPGSAHAVEIEMTAYRADTGGSVQLNAAAGWQVTPASQSFRLAAVGVHAKFKFNVSAPTQLSTAAITASASINGARFASQRIEIRYSHIPTQILLPTAETKAVSLNLAIRGRQVGYLAGAGDGVADSLKQMGYQVTQLSGADLNQERLQSFDAVVIGIRAFNVRTDLADRMPALFAYVEAGGNVIVQYNRPEGLKINKIAPFNLQLSGERVTDETAPVTFLAPDHPTLNTPNKITAADFEGWVQERGVYFPNEWDEHFVPILACNDAGESPKSGGLLVAHSGKGYFVYTGLAWFRQLPEGVPGAYRLFANLVSLGK